METMNKKHLYIFLKPHENVAIITKDGKMANGIVHHKNDLMEFADTIQGIMIDIMKHPKAHEGIWLWKISEDWSSVSGWEIEV